MAAGRASPPLARFLALLATNPFLLTNRKYLEHKSSRITAPIWLVNAKRTRAQLGSGVADYHIDVPCSVRLAGGAAGIENHHDVILGC